MGYENGYSEDLASGGVTPDASGIYLSSYTYGSSSSVLAAMIAMLIPAFFGIFIVVFIAGMF